MQKHILTLSLFLLGAWVTLQAQPINQATPEAMLKAAEEAEKKAAAAGASLMSGVSKHLSILVVGEKAGSKLKKAQALETVEIWTEAEFLERIAPET